MNRTAKICLLGILFAICASAAYFQAVIERRWQSTPRAELYDVVSKQLSAFRSADFSGAYQQASMSFQERFNMDAFTDLARTEYPALMRSTRLEFGRVRFEGRHAIMQAYFFLPEGDVVPCIYSLVREDDAWKIEGVRVMKRWPPNRRLGGVRT